MFMLFPEGRPKAFTLSYDDGVEQDERLVDIMAKNGLRGTFNVNSGRYVEEGTVFAEGRFHRVMTEAATTALFKDSGNEVAVHAYSHLFLNKIKRERVAYEIVEDRVNLERQFGTIIRGMAYPYGTWNDGVLDVLADCGIAYARTTKATESFAIPTRWLTLDPTCHHNHPRLTEIATKFVESEKVPNDPWLFYFWGHSYEFERDNNWDLIEKFAEYIGGHGDVWYATNIEIYDYVMAYERLLTSIDGSLISNPSAIPVWFKLDKRVFCVNPGETISVL